ncbi:MAG: hypothetical protein HY898_20745 [Deltaproteobacteria bacterium]|nr:hypothetical protein [Deltaproteobacteria bacterium]
MRKSSWVVWGPIVGLVGWASMSAIHGCGGGDEAANNPSHSFNADGGAGSAGKGGAPPDGSVLPDGMPGGSAGAGASHCGNAPGCKESSTGPTGNPPGQFPLPSDDPAPDNVGADGVGRDQNGYLGLDSTHHQFDYLWIADDVAYGVGFVSKVSTKPFPTAPTWREVARYVTFTCKSNPTGSNEDVVLGQPHPGALCADGVNGCCSVSETVKGPNNGHAAVNVYQNRPSRTAVDINGDVWIANRAHTPAELQSSATKIANSEADCIDRNANGKIDTSKDANNDGIITTDCNDDNLPDNASTVCAAGKVLEFYGLDDECILFTTNTGQMGQYGRPLALGPGVGQTRAYGASDAWAGTWKDGTFYRIQGKTGQIIDTVKIQDQAGVASVPYGAAVDRCGILWAPNEANHQLFYFDTANTSMQGMTQNPHGGSGFYGIAVDGFKQPNPDGGAPLEIQQIWLGEVGASGAYRYRPVRDQGFAGLGTGTWAFVTFTGGSAQGRGIGVDNRTPTAYAWVALDGYVPGSPPAAIGRIPTNIADGVSVLGPENTFPTGQVGTLGAGVANDLDIWGINQGTSSASHFKVDAAGNVIGAPDTVPLDDKPAAAEDFCANPVSGQCKPHPYTYSDFTGFGLRNFTVPHGVYTWIQQGCLGGKKTKWKKIYWDALTPAGTELTVQARSADTKPALNTATYTGAFKVSPADLEVKQAPGPLAPNPADYLQVEFDFTTTNSEESPKLKSFQIVYECVDDVPQ